MRFSLKVRHVYSHTTAPPYSEGLSFSQWRLFQTRRNSSYRFCQTTGCAAASGTSVLACVASNRKGGWVFCQCTSL